MAASSLRLAPELKASAASYAESIGISMNALIAVALTEYLAGRVGSATRGQVSRSDHGDGSGWEGSRLREGPDPDRSPVAAELGESPAPGWVQPPQGAVPAPAQGAASSAAPVLNGPLVRPQPPRQVRRKKRRGF